MSPFTPLVTRVDVADPDARQVLPPPSPFYKVLLPSAACWAEEDIFTVEEDCLWSRHCAIKIVTSFTLLP